MLKYNQTHMWERNSPDKRINERRTPFELGEQNTIINYLGEVAQNKNKITHISTTPSQSLH